MQNSQLLLMLVASSEPSAKTTSSFFFKKKYDMEEWLARQAKSSDGKKDLRDIVQ